MSWREISVSKDKHIINFAHININLRNPKKPGGVIKDSAAYLLRVSSSGEVINMEELIVLGNDQDLEIFVFSRGVQDCIFSERNPYEQTCFLTPVYLMKLR